MASCRLRQFIALKSSLVYAFLVIATCSSLCCLGAQQEPAASSESALDVAPSADGPSRSLPANHRGAAVGDAEPEQPLMGPRGVKSSASRQGRQYEGTMSAAGTGSYGTLSGDGASYMGQVPMSAAVGAGAYGGAAGASGSASSYASDLGAGFYHSAGPAGYHEPMSMGRGYPSAPGPPMHHSGPPGGYPGMGGLLGPQSMFGSGGLLSGGFPLMSKGFDLGEIVCTAIAVAIGAVIIGAPFILIYLFVMNQMNGNGPSAMGPSGGAISLTGPTSSTTVNGRKKRHTSLPEALFKQLSPLVNSEQVASTFKALMSSMAKYQM